MNAGFCTCPVSIAFPFSHSEFIFSSPFPYFPFSRCPSLFLCRSFVSYLFPFLPFHSISKAFEQMRTLKWALSASINLSPNLCFHQVHRKGNFFFCFYLNDEQAARKKRKQVFPGEIVPLESVLHTSRDSRLSSFPARPMLPLWLAQDETVYLFRSQHRYWSTSIWFG